MQPDSGQRTTLRTTVGKALPETDLLDVWRSVEASSDRSFFIGSMWIGSWLKTTKPDARVLVAWNEDTPVGAAVVTRAPRSLQNPLRQEYRVHETGNSQKDGIFIEYNGILSARGFEASSLQCIVDRLRRETAGRLERFVPAYLVVSAASPGFTSLFQNVFPGARIIKQDQSPYVDLAALRANKTDYLATLSANTRQQLNQARRRIDERGALSLDRARDVDEAMEFLSRLKPLHVARWHRLGKPSGFDNPFFEPFLKELIAGGVPNGTVEVLRSMSGTKPVGYLVNFSSNGHVLNYTSGFDYETFDRLKPGLITHLLAIEDADKRGCTRYNFLAGGSRYKTSLSNEWENLSWLRLQL